MFSKRSRCRAFSLKIMIQQMKGGLKGTQKRLCGLFAGFLRQGRLLCPACYKTLQSLLFSFQAALIILSSRASSFLTNGLLGPGLTLGRVKEGKIMVKMVGYCSLLCSTTLP